MGATFAANHVAARIAFDHGASVAASVTVRATTTALVLFLLMRVQGVAVRLPRTLRPQALLAGLLIATQSYSLYSAVALIPPALALLVFQTSPMLYVLHGAEDQQVLMEDPGQSTRRSARATRRW